MRTIREAARTGRTAPLQLLMLPAAYTGPEDFVAAGFGTAVRERQLNVDVTFAALEFRHVGDRTVIGEVWERLIAPARAQGSAVWLGGISLGGFVALSCAEREPTALAGLCLFAPYLCSHIVTSEVARAGIGAWAAAAGEDDEERRVWRFIQSHAATKSPSIHLGLGREDRFGERHRLLAATLDPSEVDTVAGGHDWPTWRRLWDNFLDARIAAARP
jgi:pimeloyl-ACP methyl ester carboxylesterase